MYTIVHYVNLCKKGRVVCPSNPSSSGASCPPPPFPPPLSIPLTLPLHLIIITTSCSWQLVYRGDHDRMADNDIDDFEGASLILRPHLWISPLPTCWFYKVCPPLLHQHPLLSLIFPVQIPCTVQEGGCFFVLFLVFFQI